MDWIDVNDQLPERSGFFLNFSDDVLIALEDGECRVSFYNFKKNKFETRYESDKVVFWAKIEQPPHVVN